MKLNFDEFLLNAKENQLKSLEIHPAPTEVQIQIPKKSLAGMIWFEKSLKKTIGLYLIVNAAILFFSSELYVTNSPGGKAEVSFLGELVRDNNSASMISSFVNRIVENHDKRQTTILTLQVFTQTGQQTFTNDSKRLNSLRESEFMVYRWSESDSKVQVYMVEDRYQNAWQESLLQVLSMVFACFVLTTAFFMGSQDSKIWFTGPYSLIMDHVNKLIRRPIDYSANPYYLHSDLEKIDDFNELEEEYKKLGRFFFKYTPYLSYAFGSKQANLVADRLLVKKPKSLLDIKGDTYYAYICVLQLTDLMKIVDENSSAPLEQMSKFTQKVQEVIQRTTDKFGGSTFCGVDGKFTLVWRLHSSKYDSNFIHSNRNSTESAAMCITCVLKLIAKLLELWKVFRLDELKSNSVNADGSKDSIQLTNIAQILRCVVNCGRVYEHIVGSLQKVDVICMGPDIAMTDRFHKLAIVYTVPILINQVVYHNLADSVKKQCRKVDIVKLKHFAHQLDVYSLDVYVPKRYMSDDFDDDINDRVNYDLEPLPTSDYRLLHSGIKEKVLERLINGAKNSIFFEDPDIQGLFLNNWKFKRHCRKAIDFYGLGAWDMAKSELKEAITHEPNDGPCTFLLKFLEELAPEKKAGWKGFRPADI